MAAALLLTGLVVIFVVVVVVVVVVVEAVVLVVANPPASFLTLLHALHSQVFGIIFTICQGKIIDRFGTLAGNIFLCVFLLIGTIMTGRTRTTRAAWSHIKLLVLYHARRYARIAFVTVSVMSLFNVPVGKMSDSKNGDGGWLVTSKDCFLSFSFFFGV